MVKKQFNGCERRRRRRKIELEERTTWIPNIFDLKMPKFNAAIAVVEGTQDRLVWILGAHAHKEDRFCWVPVNILM
jgi:hypothetical protein